MKFLSKYSTVLLIVLILIAGTALKTILYKEQLSVSQPPNYHFYYIGKNTTDPYWEAIEEGVVDASKDFRVAIEFATPQFSNFSEHYKALDIGILSKVDGIITYGYTDDNFTTLINDAVKGGMPLVTVESDNKESKRNAFIGTSSYRLGEEAADLFIENTGGEGKVLLVRKNLKSGNSLDESLRIDGFINRLKPYRKLEFVDIQIEVENAQSIQSAIDDALQKHPDIKVIYTPNSVDTIEASKYIVEKNIVGQVVVIGIGNSKEAIHYIKRGIIYGTVMSDPYLMGYKSVEMLMQVSENKNISVVADTGLKINTYESVLAGEADGDRQE